MLGNIEGVGDTLLGNKLLECAGYLHDCGKPFTKSFVNSKGEEKRCSTLLSASLCRGL